MNIPIEAIFAMHASGEDAETLLTSPKIHELRDPLALTIEIALRQADERRRKAESARRYYDEKYSRTVYEQKIRAVLEALG